jgi:hypothetical protein
MDALLNQGAVLAGGLAGLGAALLFLGLLGLAWQVYERARLLASGDSVARRTLADYRSAASASRAGGRVILPKPLRAALSALRKPSLATIVPPAAGAIMAALSGDAILGTYLVLLGVALALYLAYRQTLLYHQRVGDDVRRLIDAFAALYVVNPATFAALDLATNRLGAGILKEVTEGAVREYGATRDAHQALARLYAVGDPYLSRFALILAQAGEQGTDEIARLVADLARRLRLRWTTRLTAQGVFSAVRGTLTVVAGAVAAAAGAAAVAPLWRDAYVARRPMYIALTLVASLAAVYFDRKMRLDEEALL